MTEPLPIALELIRSIESALVGVRFGVGRNGRAIWSTDEMNAALNAADARVRPLVELLREARGFIAENDGGSLPSTVEFLNQIDAALKAAGAE